MTQAAGMLLVRYGLIGERDLIDAERVRQRDGGTLGEALIRLGIVSEEKLVDFYHRRLMVPRVGERHFANPKKRALAALPADMAAEFRVFPVDLDREGTLTLAMSDPSDTHVVDEVTFFTGSFCQRAAAPESLLREAIERHYGVRFHAPPIAVPAHPDTDVGMRPLLDEEVADQPAAPTPSRPPKHVDTAVGLPPPPPDDDEPVLLTKVKSKQPSPDDIVEEPELPLPGVAAVPLTRKKAPEAPILLDKPVARADSKTPTLTGLPTVAVPDPPLAALRATETRDDIARVLLDYVGAMTPRAALFVMRQGLLAGHDGRGQHLDVSSVKRMVIAIDAPSLFRDVVQSRLPYRGPLPETPANRVFAQLLGALEGEVLLLPIAVRDRPIALVYADGVATPLPDAALHAVSREAGLAYERVILASKGAAPATPGAR